MSIEDRAMSFALHVLEASGVDYAVITPDGTKHGNLEFIEKETVTTSTRRDLMQYGYVEAMEALRPGQSWSVIAPDEGTAKSLQGAMAGKATRLWGARQATVMGRGNTVHIYRLPTTQP